VELLEILEEPLESFAMEDSADRPVPELEERAVDISKVISTTQLTQSEQTDKPIDQPGNCKSAGVVTAALA
jgi:hypothetical protein